MEQEKQHPIILVFYLDREMMRNPEIIQPFAESINKMINIRNYNMLALFMPTDDNERVECINPATVDEKEMERINKLIKEIEEQFNVGDKGEEIPDIEI